MQKKKKNKLVIGIYVFSIIASFAWIFAGATQSAFYGGVTDSTYWFTVTTFIVMLILRGLWADELN